MSTRPIESLATGALPVAYGKRDTLTSKPACASDSMLQHKEKKMATRTMTFRWGMRVKRWGKKDSRAFHVRLAWSI